MIRYKYRITGRFYEGMTWEDFFAIDKCGPPVTIETNDHEPFDGREVQEDVPVGQFCLIRYNDQEEWFDVVVHCLDRDSARQVLSIINNCEPDEIEIVEEDWCLAV